MTNCYINDFNDEICHDSGWLLWGRWVVLGSILAVALAIYLIAACLSARKRHRAGVKPFPGTQWTLAVNPPAYQSRESLPMYSARGRKALSDVEGADEVPRAPSVARVPEERV
ncbi:hypothetical protein CLAFUW4_14636 [Fulvia fulva]|uniref:Uncharacterized protein n=1 Tax=Passalora fulva TaxID=5499 RepID=A0A9Q8PLU3_PASFU|nr:uncharacterized protein CLAFUR5_14465 [Fulvia fulva]KAK4609365.1 hypothetical protein CLAFUR4_14630 [Fulvia fulva]KAK4609554.1 hypothetical protein CLAFUR0_14630 [Fulvia fulva]UJO24989.1 hypothetical protein CLAFUR5_14465 [Fulvia fulva]WPV22893.1 hypothetical protein CLAFUW4_14636 [Fulvia fulva]WPV37577.1 hypothetical protein CLAFUW7_14639 [Fulvia fulva]